MNYLLIFCLAALSFSCSFSQEEIILEVDLRLPENESLIKRDFELESFLRQGIKSGKLLSDTFNQDGFYDKKVLAYNNAIRNRDSSVIDFTVHDSHQMLPLEEIPSYFLYKFRISGFRDNKIFTPQKLHVYLPNEFNSNQGDELLYSVNWDNMITYLKENHPKEIFYVQKHPLVWRGNMVITKSEYIIDRYETNDDDSNDSFFKNGQVVSWPLNQDRTRASLNSLGYWGYNYAYDQVPCKLYNPESDVYRSVDNGYGIKFNFSYHYSMSSDIVPIYVGLNNLMFKYEVARKPYLNLTPNTIKSSPEQLVVISESIINLKETENDFLVRGNGGFVMELLELAKQGKITLYGDFFGESNREISFDLVRERIIRKKYHNKYFNDMLMDSVEKPPIPDSYLIKPNQLYLFSLHDEVTFLQKGDVFSIKPKAITLRLPNELSPIGVEIPIADFDFEQLLRVAKHEGKKNLYQGLIKLQEGKGLRWIEQTSRPFIK